MDEVTFIPLPQFYLIGFRIRKVYFCECAGYKIIGKQVSETFAKRHVRAINPLLINGDILRITRSKRKYGI